jgi:hypothetical protein
LLLQIVNEIGIASNPFGSYGDVSAPAFVKRLPNGTVLSAYAHAGMDYGQLFAVSRLLLLKRLFECYGCA